MKIKIKVRTNKKIESVILQEGIYIVSVKEPAVEGKANKRVIELLAKKFDVSKSVVQITTGKTSNIKTVIIKADNLVQ